MLVHHGDERTDDWYWLREREDPGVREYLEAENAFTEGALAHLAPLREQLFEEIRGRVQETDASAPNRHGEHEYFRRTREGLQYPVYCRRPSGTPGLPDSTAVAGNPPGEVVVLDENGLAGESGYFALGALSPSPDQHLLAYSTDYTGGERYELRFRDLDAGTDFDDVVPDTYYGVGWANDGETVLYTRPTTPCARGRCGATGSAHQRAPTSSCSKRTTSASTSSIDRTRSGKYLIVTAASKLTTEVWFVEADTPTAPLRVVTPRRDGVEYHVEHHESDLDGDQFYVMTNDDAENFKLMVTPTATPGHAALGRGLGPPRGHAARRHRRVRRPSGALERADALEQIRVLELAHGTDHVVDMPDEVYSVGLGTNLEYNTTVVRIEYTSLVRPPSSFDYELDTRELTLVREQPVTGYDRSSLETHREWATASDGTKIPISIVHRRDLVRDGQAPMLLYGYGAYEISIDPTFSTARLSLLDRGVVFAIAHVRGGGEGGRRWYEDGKLTHKRNSFTDFVASADHLIAQGYTQPDRLAARGGSAGGLLMGAVANLAPDRFAAIVAEVPFVDCLTTILDPALPLTVTEWEEWGNPLADPEIYAYMKTYSPYDNVTAMDYPAMLVTGGLHDPRVQYWEPAKWVARLRATKTDDHLVVLKTEMDSGHSGPSGRYDAWRDEAFVLSFVLEQIGAIDA